MNKPVGGRGKKAPYQTTHLRVPIPVAKEIEAIIADYRRRVSNNNFLHEYYADLHRALQDFRWHLDDLIHFLEEQEAPSKESDATSKAKLSKLVDDLIELRDSIHVEESEF